ncbi:MAG: PEP-CTERM sorting domain-containing protein [Planctomycetaceae bacterium]
MKHLAFCLAAFAMIAAAANCHAAPITVSAVGENGWVSTDTRVAGVNATTPAQIDSRIDFVGIAGSLGGAVQLSSPASNDKATIATINTTTGFGGLAGFTAEYRWFKDSPVGAPAPALKLGLRTSDFVAGPASRIGEENWDKVLVYEPYDNPDAGSTPVGSWVTQTISDTAGTWSMFSRQGANLGPFNLPHNSLTITQWLSDALFGTRLSGATIVDIQLGVGSGNANTVGYVDYLITNRLNGGDMINFIAPVPEPSSIALLGFGAMSLAGYGWKRRKNSVNVG